MQQNCGFLKKLNQPARRMQQQAMPERHFILPEWARGEGISKGNLVPLGPPVGVRDPLRRGPGFLLLFSIKSKEEMLCFAERVPNGRIPNLVQEKFWFDCAQPVLAPLFFLAFLPLWRRSALRVSLGCSLAMALTAISCRII